MRLKRRSICVLQIKDEQKLDFDRFFRGELALRTVVQCRLVCALTGEEMSLEAQDLPLIACVHAHAWSDLAEVSRGDAEIAARLRDLAERGVLLSDPPSSTRPLLHRRESALEGVWWDDWARIYHARSCWRDVTTSQPLCGGSLETVDQMSEKRGSAPAHFSHRASAAEGVDLALPDACDPWLTQLQGRRTVRTFRTETALPLASLAYVLHVVYGAQGLCKVSPDLSVIRRTSPSAGAMHPIEAYVLAIHVDALRPGLYHHESDTHRLRVIETMDRSQARDVALRFVARQDYFADAHALIIQVARFDRGFWKYPRDSKAYGSVLLDAGHLSQTHYLTAERQGLGAFFTSAINDGDIADRLGLDTAREAAVGINGLGIPGHPEAALHLQTAPFIIERSNPEGIACSPIARP